MSTTTFNQTPVGHIRGSLFKSIAQYVARQVDDYKTYVRRERAIRQSIHELQSCTDRELEDIGIRRSDIESTIRAGY